MIVASIRRINLRGRPAHTVVIRVSHQTVETNQDRRCRRDHAIQLRNKSAPRSLVGKENRIERLSLRHHIGNIVPECVARGRDRTSRRNIFRERHPQSLKAGDIHRLFAAEVVTDRGLAGSFADRGRRRVIVIARHAGRGGRGSRRRWRRRRATRGGVDRELANVGLRRRPADKTAGNDFVGAGGKIRRRDFFVRIAAIARSERGSIRF